MYERKQDSQVFYVLPVESILGKLPVVPVGDTGTIPYSMRQHAADSGIKRHDCAFVSLLWEYDAAPPGTL